MVSSTLKSLFLPVAVAGTVLHAAPAVPAPDSIVLKDGRTVRGIILRNTAGSVLLQEAYSENEYPKSDIVRILDEADIGTESTRVFAPGELPPWRVLVNDLRLDDAVGQLRQIPATTIDEGVFRDVPYLSFRVNDLIELNIYGDPDAPAGVEFGAYGGLRSKKKVHEELRSFVAGYMGSRAGIGALYSLPFTGGSKQVGDVVVEITPPDAPDAYGGWWISVFNPRKLDEVRMDEEEYRALTRDPGEIVRRDGRVVDAAWTDDDLSAMLRAVGGGPLLARGFRRDADGTFRLIPAGGD